MKSLKKRPRPAKASLTSCFLPAPLPPTTAALAPVPNSHTLSHTVAISLATHHCQVPSFKVILGCHPLSLLRVKERERGRERDRDRQIPGKSDAKLILESPCRILAPLPAASCVGRSLATPQAVTLLTVTPATPCGPDLTQPGRAILHSWGHGSSLGAAPGSPAPSCPPAP